MTGRGARLPDVHFVGYLTGHGGDALQMLALADGLHRRGVHVRITVPAGEQSVSFQERCERLGIECERTSMLVADMQGSGQRFGDQLSLLRALDAPLVHFHTGNSCLPRTTMLAMTALRFPRSFVTLQSPYETLAVGSIRARCWAAAASRRFTAVVSPSSHGTAFQRRCGVPTRLLATVRNAVDISSMAAGDADTARAAAQIGSDDKIVLFCSRVDGQKRPLDAVRAFARVADEFPCAVLVVVGRGNLEADVAREAERLGMGTRVKLVGYQTNVPDWLAAATVWILPTERENFSVAVLEAMAAGCPVVSTDCPGNDEILVDEQNALTVALGDVDGMARSLRRLLADESLRRRLGEAARRTSAEHSVERMVDGYCNLYLQNADAPASIRAALRTPALEERTT